MVGADCLFCRPFAEVERSAMVRAHWRSHRPGLYDQIHHGVLCCRDFRRYGVDGNAPVLWAQMVLDGGGAGFPDLPAQLDLAVSARSRLPAFLAAHSST